jgi:hypothetical protein
MITPSFSLTATERVLPKLALDFTTASLDPRVTFTRTGNTATVVNSSGLITPINADLPRFDHDPVTLACKGLLIEESRTNNLIYSQDFSQYNAIVGASINATAATAPDGTNTFGLLTEDTSTGSHYIQKRINVLPPGTYTLSLFVKLNGNRRFGISETNANGFQTVFDLTTQTVVSNAIAVNPKIENYGNNVYRVSLTYTTTISAANVYRYLILPANATSTGTTYTGDGTSGVYLWGDQVETGAFPTSYIPTVASTVTRNADVATMTSTNFSDWYNATEGTLYADGIAVNRTATYTAVIAELAGSAGNNLIELYGLTNARGQAIVTDNAGAVTANPFILNGFPLGAQGKIAFAYKVNDFAISCNGAAVSTDTSGALPTGQSTLQIGRYNAGSAYWNSTIGKIMYWPQRLTNAEVQAFSK